jgi:hypothetical protein
MVDILTCNVDSQSQADRDGGTAVASLSFAPWQIGLSGACTHDTASAGVGRAPVKHRFGNGVGRYAWDETAPPPLGPHSEADLVLFACHGAQTSLRHSHAAVA